MGSYSMAVTVETPSVNRIRSIRGHILLDWLMLGALTFVTDDTYNRYFFHFFPYLHQKVTVYTCRRRV